MIGRLKKIDDDGHQHLSEKFQLESLGAVTQKKAKHSEKKMLVAALCLWGATCCWEQLVKVVSAQKKKRSLDIIIYSRKSWITFTEVCSISHRAAPLEQLVFELETFEILTKVTKTYIYIYIKSTVCNICC